MMGYYYQPYIFHPGRDQQLIFVLLEMLDRRPAVRAADEHRTS